MFWWMNTKTLIMPKEELLSCWLVKQIRSPSLVMMLRAFMHSEEQNYENILRFSDSFVNYDCVKLEQNYRSNQGVLNFLNQIIDNSVLSFKKELYCDKSSRRKPILKQLANPEFEASYITRKIRKLKSTNQLNFSDFAILTRAGRHSDTIQAEFIAKDIPFTVRGGIKFVERAQIKDVISFLKIITNPLDAGLLV